MIFSKYLIIVILSLFVYGCSDINTIDTPTQIGLEAPIDTSNQIATTNSINKALKDASITNYQEGSIIKIRNISPAETTYKGEGKNISRSVVSARIFSPFGVSPGEVISKQTPMTITEAGTPGINIQPQGVVVNEGDISKFQGSGGKWSWWDTLKQRIKDYSLIGIGSIVGLLIIGLALWFFVPAAQPIISWLLRAIASIFPIIGSFVESTIAKFKVAAVTKPLEEVINGSEKFKQLIQAELSLTQVQRDKVISIWKSANNQEQDQSTQDLINTIKG
jgi:hypothetical protein